MCKKRLCVKVFVKKRVSIVTTEDSAPLRSRAIRRLVITGLLLLLGSASKSNFWQYFNSVIKGNLIGFEIEKMDFCH